MGWNSNTPRGLLITAVYLVVAVGAAATDSIAGWVVFGVATAAYLGLVVATGSPRHDTGPGR